MTLRLFAIYVGGEHPQANIEVHDIRFILAPSIEETHEALKLQWWGRPGSLHIDCWMEITQADGYEITLRPDPFPGPEKLFYVNLGGYDRREFNEQHRNVFVVAETVAGAKTRALKKAAGWAEPHRDDLYEAEQAFALNDEAAEQRLHIHLTPRPATADSPFVCDYVPISKRKSAQPSL